MFGDHFIHDEDFSSLERLGTDLSPYYFKSCNFSRLEMDGGDLSVAMTFCTVEDCDFYWISALQTIFVKCRFIKSVFRGSTFSGTRFIECSFEDCDFTQDNLGSECSFDDTVFFRCTFTNTIGIRYENVTS
jgi:uncharacterized protein YjbI with pentapeptide repeats